MNNSDVAGILEEIGTLLELRGENPFKCRAFHNASRIVGALTEELSAIVARNGLREIKGIGEGLAEKITEMIAKGASPYYEELKASLPPGLPAMLRIQGLGPKKVKILHDKLKIKSVEELSKAAREHRLAGIDGFGEKTEENILKGIDALSRHADKHLYSAAREAAERMLAAVRAQKGVTRCDIAGSLRRRKEIIGDIDILAASKSPAPLMKAFTSHEDVEEVLARGATKSSVRLKAGINCDLRVITAKEYPFALAYFTGSKEHNVALRTLSKSFGWSLNEYDFSPLKKGGKTPQCSSEEEIYRSLKLAYVPPELRENMGEVEAAGEGKLPALVEPDDIRGTFHCHTNYSDGANTLAEMAAAARKLGWEYLGIADHSKVAAYAGGLSEARVKEQHREIDRMNAGFGNFRLFKGTEADILPDGKLDWSDAILARFDYVVASIHSKFSMTEKEATARIIKALKNKYVTMLGHPTGRLLLQRDGYPVNMIDVINAAADYGKMIEINAHPLRLDLDWRLCRLARDKGVMISINPDAHTTKGLLDVEYGVGVARKGWLRKNDILNARPLKGVLHVLKLQ